MIRYIVTILVFLLSTTIQSQNQVISKLKQPPINKFGIADLWAIELNNTTKQNINGYLVGTLTEATDGLIVEARSKVFTIKPGRTTYGYRDLNDASISYNNNHYREILLRTGGLPDGEYTICITVYNENDEIIGQENCIYHTVKTLGNISLISPANEEELNNKLPIIFSWTPLPNVQNYTLKIVEVIGRQTPEIAINNNPAFFKREDLRGNSFQYPLSEKNFDENKTYAWQVYSSENPELTASEIWVFKFSRIDTSNQSNLRNITVTNCGSNLPPLVITNTTPDNKDASEYVDNYIKVGYFQMKVLSATGNSSGLDGKGSILVPWLKTPIAVEFQKIKINSDTVMYSGTVYSETDSTPEQWPQQWGINVVGNFNWTTSQIKNLNDWLHNKLSGWPVTNKLVKDFDLLQMVQQYTNNPLKLPLGLNNLSGYTIAISEMKFEPTKAYLSCLAVFPVEDDTIAFKGSSFEFTPGGGPIFSTGELALIDDVTISGNIPNGDSYEIKIKKATGRRVAGVPKGTYVIWDCNGFKQINLDVDISFPRSWLTPVPDNGEKAKASFTAQIDHWENLIVKTSLQKCKIVGTAGVELEISDLWFDQSVALNPDGMLFPVNYPSNAPQGTDFKGFYIKNAKLTLPNNFLNNNQNLEIYIQKMIINKFGLTGEIAAVNLATLNFGNIAGMSASFDSLKIILLSSSITDAYLKGKIILPISSQNAQNALLYKVNLKNSNGLQVNLQPQNPISAELFGNATLTLSNNSTFDMWINNNVKFLMKIHGNFKFANVNLFNLKRLNMAMNFQNVKLDYDESRSTDKLSIDAGQWSFASPQKFIANIPITIKNIKYEKRTSQGNELLRGALKFGIDVNLNEKFSGSSNIAVIGSVSKVSNKFQPSINGAEIDTIKLAVNLSAVKLKGMIAFFNEDQPNGNIYGNGFGGNITATFNSIQTEVTANFKAGSTKYNNGSNYFRYWFAEAKAILPKQYAITFLPGVAFYGFGAAAWQRVNVSNIPAPTPNEVQNASNTSTSPNSGATISPDNNIGFGFKAMAVIGTYPEPKTFNLDAAINAQFATNGGLNKLSFVTNFWGMAELIKRDEAPIYGDVTIEYTPPDKLFMMNANAFIKYPRSSGSIINTQGIGNPNDKVNLTLYINGKTNKWYFLAGKPSQTNKVKVLGITMWEYAMFGNDLAQFVKNGFQPSTLSGLASAGVNLSGVNTQIPSLAGTGRGFSFGTGVNFSISKTLDMGWLSWAVGGRTPQLRYGGGGGFEINLSLLQYNCNIGINNWYAQGSAAAWLYGYAKVWLARKTGTLTNPCLVCCKCCAPESGCEATLAALKAGFWTQAGFPNPAWVQGSAHVYVNVFGLNWSGNVDISWGNQPSCNTLASQTQTFVAEDATQKIGQLILNVVPESGEMVNPATKIKISTSYECFTPFEIPELQSDGTIKTRTFALVFQPTLKKITFSGSLPNISINEINQTMLSSSSPGTTDYYFWINRNNPPGVFRNFDDNSTYKLEILATLFEYQNGSFWPAKDRNNNLIQESITKIFSTSELLQLQNNNPNPPTGNN